MGDTVITPPDTRFIRHRLRRFPPYPEKPTTGPAAISQRRHGEHSHSNTGVHTAFTPSRQRPGSSDALGWGAVQTGRWGTQTQFAWALDFEGGFQPAILPRVKPWIRAGYTIGSGDGNPNDNRHETFFQILPTPRPYARFPFFNMMNTEDAFGSLLLRPHAKVTISSEFHSLRLTNPNDLWYSGGGAFQPVDVRLYESRSTSGRRSLGNLYDTSVEYRANRHMIYLPRIWATRRDSR